jgi:hypothetical protein
MMGDKMSCAVLQLIRGQDSGCSRSCGWQEAQEGQQLCLFLVLCDLYSTYWVVLQCFSRFLMGLPDSLWFFMVSLLVLNGFFYCFL